MYRIDLHTHSIVSYDGGISFEQYKKLLSKQSLDFIAITDHNEISEALKLHDLFGPKIIVGEEILTTDGEIIGLFLSKKINPGMNAEETIKAIREQNGLVYIPHPLEQMRKGLSEKVITEQRDQIDIIEIFNARGKFRGRNEDAKKYLSATSAGAASSDAHCRFGIGTAFSIIEEPPTRENLQELLIKGTYQEVYAPLWSYLCPAINKLKKYVV